MTLCVGHVVCYYSALKTAWQNDFQCYRHTMLYPKGLSVVVGTNSQTCTIGNKFGMVYCLFYFAKGSYQDIICNHKPVV